jgi:hypothetical protein
MIRRFQRAPEAVKAEYGDAYMKALAAASDRLLNSHNWEPHNVVMAIVDAVQLRYPSPQVMLGLDARTAIALTRQLPSWLQEALQRFQFGCWRMPLPAAAAVARQQQQQALTKKRGGGGGREGGGEGAPPSSRARVQTKEREREKKLN